MKFVKIGILTFCFTLFFIANGFGQTPDTTIYKVLDTSPEFRYATEENTGNSLKRYVMENFKMPQVLLDNCYVGRITVQFVVEKSGLVSQAKILRGMGGDLDKAVLEFIKTMPNWVAGKKGGRVVRSHVIIPIPVMWLYGEVTEENIKNQSNKTAHNMLLESNFKSYDRIRRKAYNVDNLVQAERSSGLSTFKTCGLVFET